MASRPECPIAVAADLRDGLYGDIEAGFGSGRHGYFPGPAVVATGTVAAALFLIG